MQEKGLFILTEKETKSFESWLTAKQVDFLLVRPDKIIFGAGKKADFESILAEFYEMIGKKNTISYHTSIFVENLIA